MYKHGASDQTHKKEVDLSTLLDVLGKLCRSFFERERYT